MIFAPSGATHARTLTQPYELNKLKTYLLALVYRIVYKILIYAVARMLVPNLTLQKYN